ncbi:MAG: CsbD family protein [Deltaproteobacteria bacterium]|nr:CsbD family protein [Deltaproteobacteria bacterium]
MSGTLDKAKGRVKEAVGALTDDPKLKREGRIDQGAGSVKDAAERVKDAAEKAVDKVKDALKK